MSGTGDMSNDVGPSQQAILETEPAQNAALTEQASRGMAALGTSNGEAEPTTQGIEDSQLIAQEGTQEDAHEDNSGHELETASGDSGSDIDDNYQSTQEEVIESVEQDIEPDPESLHHTQTDTGMADPLDKSHEHTDTSIDDSTQANVQLDPGGAPDDHIHEVYEQEDGKEPMSDLQAETIHQSLGDSNSQSTYINDEGHDNDSSSLFVPERATPAPQTHDRQVLPVRMPPPPRPSATPSTRDRSVFAKIRNMQRANADKRNAVKKLEEAQRYRQDPDSEAYLNSVMSTITPSASTPGPAVDEDDMADRKASAEYHRLQKHYAELRRNNGGTLSFRQDVEWMRIKCAEKARKNKRARDLAKARDEMEIEPGLFPGASPGLADVEDDDEGDSDNTLDSARLTASRKRRRREMPRKEPKQISMQEAELQSMRVALEANEDVPKKKRKIEATDDDSQDTRSSKKGKGSKPKPKMAKSKAASKSTTKDPRKSAKNKRVVDYAVKQATSLFTADVFAQQAGEDDAEQPTFRARNKQDALKELIASVPIEDKKQARSDMAVLLAATKDFDGRGSVKAAGGNWLVKGMTTSLKGYQVLGSAFMRRRENAVEEPRGGLMADQMGLGKTLMMLANIVNGQPPKGKHPRTTLLVASPALLSQWSEEIQQHTDCGLRVMRYGSGTRIDSNSPFDVLKYHDIILTSYNEVMKSYPKNEPPIECQTAEQKIAWWKAQFETQRGVLHRMMFLRIVLDEAQMIKNHTGRTSIACRALIARHKWALSGTPILNSLTELYPYFKFLGVPHTGSFKIFKHNYCDTKDAENTERLLVRLSQFMIRRTHADKLLNLPILKLPRADQGTFWCDFNPVERCIYDIVHQRFARNINMWQKKGELEKSYSNALVMLLRLRQLTAHVLMLQFVMRDLLEVEDIERIKDVVKQESADSSTRSGRTIIAIRKQLEVHAISEKKRAAAKAAAKAAGEDEDNVSEDEEVQEEPQPTDEPDPESGLPTAQVGASAGGSGKAFGKEYNFKPFLQSLKTGDSWEKAKKRARCSYCDRQPKDPWIASCGHIICATPCLEVSYVEAAEVGKDYASCKACGITPVSVLQFEVDETDPFDAVARGTRSKAAMKAAKQRERRDREDISEDWLSLAGADVLPSAKTLAIKAQIMNWWKEDPNVKIIIYTQFLAM
jgi:SNF2 family DNA or RNA helicase